MYGSAFQPAMPQLPGQVLIASSSGSGLSPKTQRYKSISNKAGFWPKPIFFGSLCCNDPLSCSVKKRSQTRSAMFDASFKVFPQITPRSPNHPCQSLLELSSLPCNQIFLQLRLSVNDVNFKT